MLIVCQSSKQWIKEDLIKTDLINQLDIAYGLKQLLIDSTFTMNSLRNAPASELAKILGIDDYVAGLHVLLSYNRKITHR